MKKQVTFERFLAIFIPWGLAVLFKSDALLSYFIAWLGSFFIFAITLTGWVKPLPDDRSFSEQLMRPILLVQVIFAGYMCCTSVFYMFNTLGYDNFHKIATYFLVDTEKVKLIAQCQRYYVLAHASLVTGILIFMKYPEKQKYKIDTESIAGLLFVAALIALPLSLILLRAPGLSQFSNQFTSLSFIAGTLALAFAIPLKKVWNTIICLFLYFSNFYTALTSGFKEPIIISIMVLGVFLYPNYKKLVTIVFVPVLLTLFLLLPTYARVFRQNNWASNVDADEATKLALNATLGNGSDIEDTNWGFFVFRLSEVDMFTEYVQSTPDKVSFYGLEIVKQSAIAIIPRIFWPTKPVTEDLVMERVYNAGVINRASDVSAKPAFIVDSYLSGGNAGIIIALFIYGATAQLISRKAEELFGGYLLGTALIFSGLFQIYWRGLSFEFIVNTVFWSYVTMLIIHRVLVAKNILQHA